jgi:hypothetical protein
LLALRSDEHWGKAPRLFNGEIENMKEQKPLSQGSGQHGQSRAGSAEDNGVRGMGQRSQGSGSVEQMPVRLPTMQNEIQSRKRRGRLGRDAQVKLGKTLQAYFDDVVKEGVPDRFRILLQQAEERKDKGSS